MFKEDDIEYLAAWLQMTCEDYSIARYGRPIWGNWSEVPDTVRNVHRELAVSILDVDPNFVLKVRHALR